MTIVTIVILLILTGLLYLLCLDKTEHLNISTDTTLGYDLDSNPADTTLLGYDLDPSYPADTTPLGYDLDYFFP